MNSMIAIDVKESLNSDLFSHNQTNLLRFDRDTTCGSGIEVEYVGFSGKLLYHRDADRLFSNSDTSAALAALQTASGNHYKGTGINPIFVHDESSSLGRELKMFTRKVAKIAKRLLQMRLS